jgi:type IV pilus assembly protein PilM
MFTDNILIGLDIGSSAIKMTEIKHTKTGKELQTFGIAYHTLDLNGHWDAQKLRKLSIIIDDIMKSNQFNGVRTVISVMSKDVYVTTMDFEADWDKARIQNEIERQAPYFLPYPPDEMRLSWKPIPKEQDIIGYLNKQRVSIKALPDFVVDNSKNLLEHINLDGIVLENQTEAQIRSLLTPDNGNTILVDIGHTQITFNIVIDTILRSSSHIPIGTGQITKELSANLGIDSQSAEYFKRDLHIINLRQFPKPILDFYKILQTELMSFVDLNKKIGQTPNKIVLTGGGVATAGFYEFFQNNEIPIYFGNSLRNINVNEVFKPIITPINNQFSTAIGLAMYDGN